MTEKRTQIHLQRKGSLAEHEDWWTLVETNNGRKLVEHEWSYVDPYKLSSPGNSGKSTMTVEEFLASGADANVIAKLRELLA